MKRVLLLLLFTLLMSDMKAQSFQLVIQMSDNVETVWNDGSLSTIYFDGDTTLVVVEKESLDTYAYSLSEVKKLYFKPFDFISEINQDEAFFVYPNPTGDAIRLIGVDNQDVEIISVEGKSMFKGYYDGSPLNVSHLPQGIYFIKSDNKILKFTKI